MKSLLFAGYTLLLLSIQAEAHGSEVIGFYSKGSLDGAQSVFERGTPIHKLFLSRQRIYTSDEMHNVLFIASDYIAENFPASEALQVGDLSASAGGLVTGHASHQNGLDADVVYLRKDGHVQNPTTNSWDEDFVSGNKPTANFYTERNFALFKYLVATTPVARIFVDVAIKRNLCQYALKNGQMKDPQTLETLRRLRPQDLHRTHFHVRISCPADDHECIPQSEPPTGSGCDELSILLEAATPIHTC